jgi:iron complex outermembrane receptor protein
MSHSPLRHAVHACAPFIALAWAAWPARAANLSTFDLANFSTPAASPALPALPAWRDAAREPDIIGTVTDSAGTPLANVQVYIPAIELGTTTNARGVFIIRSLHPGTYHLTAQRIGYAPAHRDVTIPATGDDVRVTIQLRATPLTLSTVQVTATPTATDPQNVAQATTELSGAALARNLETSVAQTLEGEPGISVRYNGPAASAPVIRGLQGDRILVLENGERTGDLSAAAPDHAVSIDPLAAQRIEVVRGPASLLYGNNALGGVVNVISNDIPMSVPSHVEGYVGGQAESVNPGGAMSGGVTIPAGESLALTLRGGWRDVQDVRQGGGAHLENTYARNYYGVGGFGLSKGAVTGGLVYRGYQFDYGLPSAPDDDEAGVHIEGHRQEVVGRAAVLLPGTVLSDVRVNGTAQWYAHDEVERTGAIGTSFSLETQTADVMGRTQLGSVTGAIGLSGLFKQYVSTGEEALTPAANSKAGGVFIYQDIPLHPSPDPDARVPHLQLGGRYDLYRIASRAGDAKFGAPRSLSFDSWSGSVGLTVPLSASLSLGVSAARAFRAPTVEELFSNAFHAAAGTYDKGNPNLRAETNRGLDGVLRMQSGAITAQLSGFYNRINDYVAVNIVRDTVIDGEDGTSTVPLNEFSQADATLKGLEGEIEAQVMPQVVLGAMGDLVRGAFEDGTPLPFIPAARLGGSARWDNGRFSLGGEIRHGFAQDRVPAPATESDPSAVPTGAYTLLNLSAGVTLSAGGRTHAITVRADNLTDARYADATSRIKSFALQPGRNFAVVYKLLF